MADLALVCRKCGADFVHPGDRVGPKPSNCPGCRSHTPIGEPVTTTCARCDASFTHTDSPRRQYCDDCRAASRRRSGVRTQTIAPQDSQVSPTNDRACVQCHEPLRDDQPDDALFCDSVCSNAYARANEKRGRTGQAQRRIRMPRQFDRGVLGLRSEEIVQEKMRAFRESRRARRPSRAAETAPVSW